MKELKDIIKRVKKFESGLPAKTIEIALRNEAEILDLQGEQHDAGLTNEGKQIRPDYSPFTVRIKRQKGQPTDRVTLYDEGDFRAGFFTAKGKTAFSIGSRDDKTEKLERKYRSEIFGLTDDSLQEVIDLTKPDILEHAHKAILG